MMQEKNGGPITTVNTPLISASKHTLGDSTCVLVSQWLPAAVLTLGRVFIGPGMSLFNFQKTAEAFNWHDNTIINALAYFIVITTAIDTLLGRGTSNCLRLLSPTIYLSNTNEDLTNLDQFDQSFPMTLLRDTYVIKFSNNRADLYRREPDKIKQYRFDATTQPALNDLYRSLSQQNCGEQTPVFLTRHNLKEFNKIKNNQDAHTWSTYTTALYWTIFVPAVSTAIFSSLAAVLYLFTFAEKFYRAAIFDEIFVAVGVAINLITYCTFNNRNMNDNIKRVCDRFEEGKSLKVILFGESNDTTKQIILTCLLATLGMTGNLSAAYYVMFRLLDLPTSQDVCSSLSISVPNTAITLALLNVYGSFFSGIFNMAMNSHRLMTEERTAPRTTIDIMLSTNTFLNAAVNAMQSFLGTAQLTGQKFIDWHSAGSVGLFVLRAMITLGYLYLTYGMMRQGNERSIQYFNQKATMFNCCNSDYNEVPSSDIENPLQSCKNDSNQTLTTASDRSTSSSPSPSQI